MWIPLTQCLVYTMGLRVKTFALTHFEAITQHHFYHTNTATVLRAMDLCQILGQCVSFSQSNRCKEPVSSILSFMTLYTVIGLCWLYASEKEHHHAIPLREPSSGELPHPSSAPYLLFHPIPLVAYISSSTPFINCCLSFHIAFSMPALLSPPGLMSPQFQI